MCATGLGWFMGWQEIWYVGTGWRKRLTVTLLGGHAWLWSSAFSSATTPLPGTSCRTSWPGTCVPWAYKAVRTWNTKQRGEGSTGTAAMPLHSAWSSSSTLGQHHQKVWWPWCRAEGHVLLGLGDTRAHPSPQCQWGVTACVPPPHLHPEISAWQPYPQCLRFIAELREECKCFIDHGVKFHPD